MQFFCRSKKQLDVMLSAPPDSITKFGFDVKIKSIQEEESAIRCVGSLISCCNPNWEVIASILETSYDVLSPLNQRSDFILKSPRKNGLFAVTTPMFNSKLLANDSKSSCEWFGERYKETNLHSLPPIIISKLMHSFR